MEYVDGETLAEVLRREGVLEPRRAAEVVVLAVNEAATNAIMYGSGGGQPVQVVVHVDDDMIQASVLDHGPDLPAQPPTNADTDALPVRGRGLWLLRRLVDEVRLERVRLGTRVTLRRAIGPARTLAC